MAKAPAPTKEQLEAAQRARDMPLDVLPRSLRRQIQAADTKTFREAVADLLTSESPYIAPALALVRKDNPLGYLKALTDLAEFAAPRLARVEGVVEGPTNLPTVEIVLVQRVAQPGPAAAISSLVVDAVGYQASTVEVDIP